MRRLPLGRWAVTLPATAIAAALVTACGSSSGGTTSLPPVANLTPVASASASATPSAAVTSSVPGGGDLSTVSGHTTITVVATLSGNAAKDAVLRDYVDGWHAYEDAINSGKTAALSKYYSGVPLSSRVSLVNQITKAKQTQSGVITMKLRLVDALSSRATVHMCFDQTALHYYGPDGKNLGPVKSGATYAAYFSMIKVGGTWFTGDRTDDPKDAC